MIDGKRPERVLVKNNAQTVQCPCGHEFTAISDTRVATCPKCAETVNWGLRK